MLSKIMISRNYKKRKHGVVIHLNNFASEEEKAKVINEIKTVFEQRNGTAYLVLCIQHLKPYRWDIIKI